MSYGQRDSCFLPMCNLLYPQQQPRTLLVANSQFFIIFASIIVKYNSKANFKQMKKSTLTILLLIIFSFGYSQGIAFEQGTWNEVLHKAEQSRKPIFVDVYTSWCKPCKIMSEKIFPTEEVGEVYNSTFICYKIDAEKGEGVQIAKQYEVKSFPTYLFLKADGSLIMKAIGSMSQEDFIELATSVKNEIGSPKSLSDWEKEYASHQSDTAFLRLYMDKRSLLGMSNTALFDEYLALLPEKQRVSKEIAEIYNKEIYNIKINSLAFRNLQNNSSKFSKWGVVSSLFISRAVANSLQEAIENRDEQLLEEVVKENENLFNSKQLKLAKLFGFPEQVKEELYMIYYMQTNDIEKYILNATAYCENYLMTVSLDSIKKEDKKNLQMFDLTKDALAKALDPAEVAEMRNEEAHASRDKYSGKLNEVAFDFFEKVTDQNSLNHALRWSKRSLDIYPNNHLYLDTYSNLLYKLGNQKEAISIQTKALKIVKKTKNEDEITKHEKILQNMKLGEKTWGEQEKD